MSTRPSPAVSSQIAAAMEWWMLAGVDGMFEDEPRNWLAEPEQTAPAPAKGPMPASPRPAASPATSAGPMPEPVRPTIGGDRALWPDSLSAFQAWWLEEPSLNLGGTNPPVPPRGIARPALMVLVPQPEAEDRESLLSGPQGRLLTSFLAAAGIDPAKTYLAAALPRHTPAADWPGMAGAGLGAVTRHHIALAAPERLLVLGTGILPLLGHDPAQSAALLQEVNHGGGSVPAMAAMDLQSLLDRPAHRKGLWNRWLDWTHC